MDMKNSTFRILALLILLLARETHAQKLAPCSHAASEQRIAQIEAQSWPRRPFDVQTYKLALDWRPVFKNKSQLYSGVNEIVLRITSPTDTVLLDAAEMTIDSLWINGIRYPNPPQPDGNDQLPIKLESSVGSPGNVLTIKIAYTRTSQTNDGMFFYPKGYYVGQGPSPTFDSIFVEEDVAYTMAEPLDAHKWMPCMDLPYDKAMSEISIIVPRGVSAQSNGHLDSISTNSDGSQTFHWKNDKPVSTYLMVADASTFIEWRDYYRRVSAPADSVLVNYFAWPVDYYQDSIIDGSKYNPRYAVRNTPLMLRAYSERFGEYPFNSYGQVPVHPFAYGGMEHQTMTTINRSWFRGWYEPSIGHELMHQWFGDKTTCETWSDIWLNEGFATFGESIWQEAQYGRVAYYDQIRMQHSRFFGPNAGDNTIPIYDPPILNIFNYATTYLKGGMLLHTIRRMLGNDTLFFHAIRDYSSAFAYTTANTAQFENFLTGRLGMDMSNFFNEWVYGVKWPVYQVRWVESGQGTLTIQLKQTQATPAPSVFHMPVRLIEYPHGGQPDTIVVQNDQRDQYFKLSAAGLIDSIVFDQDAIPVSQNSVVMDPALAVGQSGVQPTEFALRYEPNAVVLSWDLPNASGGTIRILDILGRVVRESSVIEPASHLAIASSQLPSGSYVAMLITPDGARTLRFIISH